MPRWRVLAKVGCAVSLLCAAIPGPVCRGEGTYTVSGEVAFDRLGDVYLSLVTREEFDKDTTHIGRVFHPSEEDRRRGSLSFTLRGAAGQAYAIRCFQDVNGNGRLDLGLFGPKEPWATWRPYTRRLRPPKFDDLEFPLDGDVGGIRLEFR